MNDRFVYEQFDQTELDAQYNNRNRFPDFEKHFRNWQSWSESTRARLPCQLDVPVGPSSLEKIDIFPAEQKAAPLYVFIHGGYWYSLDKRHYSYVAEGMRPHGVTTVVNNFGLAPDHDMDTIVDHNRSALAWLWRNAARIGADRDRIYVAGHSAGGHLALMLLGTDWSALDPALPRDLVKGVCSIGGLHDLEPIRKSYLNDKLRMSEEQAWRNSPVNLTYPFSAPLSLIAAVDESPELHRQSTLMKALWMRLGYPVELMTPPSLDHFSVVNQLHDPECLLVHHQICQMKLAWRAGLPAAERPACGSLRTQEGKGNE